MSFLLEYGDNLMGVFGVMFIVEHTKFYQFSHNVLLLGSILAGTLVLTVLKRGLDR